MVAVPRPLRRAFPVLLAAALVPNMLLSRIEARLHGLHTTRSEDTYVMPGPEALRVLCLGHREALAGIVWTRALVYFGEQVSLKGPLRYLREHIDAVIELDPDFRDAYEWAGVVTVYNSREITRASIELSNHYLDLGIRRFPADGKLVSLLAFNYAVELPPFAATEEEKQELRLRAAELFERASELPGSEHRSGLMAAEFYTRAGHEAIAEEHLKRLFVLTDDPTIRRQAERHLVDLVGEAAAAQALAEGRELFEAWQADYEYMPPDLYVLVGPRLLPKPAGDSVNADETPDVDGGPDAGAAADAGSSADAGPP